MIIFSAYMRHKAVIVATAWKENRHFLQFRQISYYAAQTDPTAHDADVRFSSPGSPRWFRHKLTYMETLQGKKFSFKRASIICWR